MSDSGVLPEEPVVIGKRRFAYWMLGGAAVIAAAVLAKAGMWNNPLPWFGLSVLLLLIGLCIANICDKRPALILDCDGMVLRPRSNEKVRWEDIVSVEAVHQTEDQDGSRVFHFMRSSRPVVLTVRGAATKGEGVRRERSLDSAPVCRIYIDVGGAKIGSDELVREIKKRMRLAGP